MAARVFSGARLRAPRWAELKTMILLSFGALINVGHHGTSGRKAKGFASE